MQLVEEKRHAALELKREGQPIADWQQGKVNTQIAAEPVVELPYCMGFCTFVIIINYLTAPQRVVNRNQTAGT